MVQQCYPPVLSETPARLKWSCRPLGFDNGYVLGKMLGLPEEEVKTLEDEGVVFRWNPGRPVAMPASRLGREFRVKTP